jgi:hypothetical protein
MPGCPSVPTMSEQRKAGRTKRTHTEEHPDNKSDKNPDKKIMPHVNGLTVRLTVRLLHDHGRRLRGVHNGRGW